MTQLLEETTTFEIDLGDCSCEFNHGHQSVFKPYRTCTDEVTHIVESTCDRQPIRLCDNAANMVDVFIKAKRVAVCKTCGRPPSSHWRLRKI